MAWKEERSIFLQLEKIKSSKKICKENIDLMTSFDHENKAKGLSPGGRIHYVFALRKLALKINKPFKEMTKLDLIDYFSWLGSELAPVTNNQYKVCTKAFFRWLEGDNEVYPDKVKWIKKDHSHNTFKLPEDILSPEEVKKMIDVADHPRDKALIHVLYDSAGRASEILDLTVGDVKFDRYGATIIVKGKTGMRRIRLINSVPDLTTWINCHKDKDNPKAPLWLNLNFSLNKKSPIVPLGLNGIGKRIPLIAERAGIKKNVHPHLFRHSRLTELAKDFSESELKIIAGWTGDSKMPKIYIHLSGADIDKKMLQLHDLIEEKEAKKKDILEPKQCPRCKEKNPSTSKFCYKCSMVLDLDTAMKLEEYREKDDKTVKGMMQRMIEMQQSMQDMFKEMEHIKGETK
ncbi:MAG: site-specific integrase [Candidatus Diapherotrites archaeon]